MAVASLEQTEKAGQVIAWWTYLLAVLAFVSGFVFQIVYISSREKESKRKIYANDPAHAGGVVYKMEAGHVKYLLIRPKDQADQWVLPKGHIVPGEGHAEAALREVREEAGVSHV